MMDKKADFKSILILSALFVLILGVFIYADANVIFENPRNYSYHLSGQIELSCSAVPNETRSYPGFDVNHSNVTNMSLWTNLTGSWARNQTNSSGSSAVNATHNTTFRINVTDGKPFQWGCEVWINVSNSSATLTYHNFTANRTLFVESPPNIVVNAPANNSFFSDSVRMNVSVNTMFMANMTPSLYCKLISNETNGTNIGSITELKKQTEFYLANDTSVNFSYKFLELRNIEYWFNCSEVWNGNIYNVSGPYYASADYTKPTVTLNSPSNGAVFNTKTVNFNFTGTDNNVNGGNCTLYTNLTHNGTEGRFLSNVSVMFVNNSALAFVNINFSNDSVYKWNVECNDSSNQKSVASSNWTFKIDTSVPSLVNVTNTTIKGACNKVAVSFESNESFNYSVKWAVYQDPYGWYYNGSVENTTLNPFPLMNVGIVNETRNNKTIINITLTDGSGSVHGGNFSVNITIWDSANNNASVNQTWFYRYAACSDWSVFPMFKSAGTTTLGEIANASSSDWVYWYNNSRVGFNKTSNWVAHQLGSQTHASVVVPYGHAVVIFSDSATGNTTFTRDRIDDLNFTGNYYPTYLINITRPSNLIATYTDFNFYNFTSPDIGVFRNSSQESGRLLVNYTSTALNGNFTMFSTYNNSAHSWVNFVYNQSKNNATRLPVGSIVWIGSFINITWNGTNIINTTYYK